MDIKEFDINMPILFDVNHENNKILMCNNNNDNNLIVKYRNVLNCNTIEYFWNLLCNQNDMSAMNFIIGINGINGQKAIIAHINQLMVLINVYSIILCLIFINHQ